MSSPTTYEQITSILEHMQRYQAKAVGLDMAMKATVYSIRLIGALSDPTVNANRVDICNTLVARITDCRMMTNQWKYLSTGPSCYELFNKRPQAPDTSFSIWLFSVLTLFFRTFEQLMGDTGYWTKNWIHTWSLPNVSWRYKFFKSLALTCGAISDFLKFLQYRRRAKEAAAVAQIQGSSADAPTSVADAAPKTKLLTEEQATAESRKSLMLCIRNIGDMIIYYQWYEGWRPNKVLCALCGMYSGFVGMYLVWNTPDGDNKTKKLK